MTNENFKVPEGLSPKAKRAALAIIETLKKEGALHSGGCKVFYSPKEWGEREEDHGHNAILIVVHDGGDHAGYFNLDYEQYKDHEKMRQALAAVGTWAEQCTSWYTGIYES